jgi:putative membrane protein
MLMTEERNSDAKYVQQHLANERTFLAWIRTAIAIVGLGFLAAGVVFHSTPYDYVGIIIVAVVSFGGVLFGASIVVFATKDYFTKQKGITAEGFRSTRTTILTVGIGLMILFVLLIVLVSFLLIW